MENFRFAIMGTGNIANKFCHAVTLLDHCEVIAAASKSIERADQFARNNGINKIYDSYEKMLKEVKIDCVYIAVTPDAHFDLCMLCLDYCVPVLCEKAMFLNSLQAKTVFQRAKALGVFVMEAMWSRFLPAIKTAKQWMNDKRIGEPVLAETTIGFNAPKDRLNRYYNPRLGGGVAYDITVYAYELTTFFITQKLEDYSIQALWSESGVDVTEQISLRFTHTLAILQTSFMSALEERMTIYGSKGKIILPTPHFASEAYLYGEHNDLILHYKDEETQNGFVYEIREVMECIQSGKTESLIVPHDLTLQCSLLFDRILETNCNTNRLPFVDCL
jgi:Predicted dehydrogenases and related proteins